MGETLLTSGVLSKPNLASLMNHSGVIAEAPLVICDKPRLNIDRLRAECRRLRKQHEVKVIAVDYLQLMEATDRRMEKRLQIGEITEGLKRMAKELEMLRIVTGETQQERREVASAGKPETPFTLADLFRQTSRAERVAMAESHGLCPIPDAPVIEPD